MSVTRNSTNQTDKPEAESALITPRFPASVLRFTGINGYLKLKERK